jgi:hypothetical protein
MVFLHSFMNKRTVGYNDTGSNRLLLRGAAGEGSGVVRTPTQQFNEQLKMRGRIYILNKKHRHCTIM